MRKVVLYLVTSAAQGMLGTVLVYPFLAWAFGGPLGEASFVRVALVMAAFEAAKTAYRLQDDYWQAFDERAR